MATTARSRGFPSFTMPNHNDKPQQPMGSGFPGSHLYPNKNIWTSSLSNARERSIGAKDSDDNQSPSGSSALNANSEADVWGPNLWNTTENPSRSVSTSPNRTRDGPMPNGSAFFDHPPPAAIGMKKNGFGGKTPSDHHDSYTLPSASQQRAPQQSAFADFASRLSSSSRDPTLPPSRQSHGSPASPELYQTHTPSNSIHSSRPLSHASYQTQTNQRAFNYNNQIDDNLSFQFGRRMALEGHSNGNQSFNPASQPFQFNPGSQPWMAENAASRFGGLEFGSAGEAVGTHYSNLKRGSVDRISPAPSYRLENGGSPRGYSQTPESWANRPSSSRDPRNADIERRASGPLYPQYSAQSYYPTQYGYANFAPPQFASPMEAYPQSYRHNVLPAGYGIAPVPHGYAVPTTNLPPLRPARDVDPGKGVRSVLLDEFRLSNKSSKRYELKDIYNYVVEFSGDQHGSRFIQQKLETANSDEKDQVFSEIEPNAIQLMKDVFGNYVVQKFFEHGNQVQKKVLAEKMRGKVVDLSVQVYACRVVQKALEHVLVEQQAELTKELEPEILRVIRDQNGNHVVQKIIELVPRQYIDFIMGSIRGQVPALASHTYGCRVIQRMLEYGSEADKAEIMAELHLSAQILITDQYGNYVAQHVIQNGKQEDRVAIIGLVMSQLLTLSKHKFASNVVEKCIEYGTAEQRSSVREQLTTVGSDGTSPLQQMMRDQYGNYVIQKLLCQLHGDERESLVEEIKPQFFNLKKNGSTRQLQALEKLLGLGGSTAGAKSDASSVKTDAMTPVLTNETNSPTASSPPSTFSNTAEAPVGEDAKATVNGVITAIASQTGEEQA